MKHIHRLAPILLLASLHACTDTPNDDANGPVLLAESELAFENPGALNAIAEDLRRHGQDPNEYFLVGDIQRSAGHLAIFVAHSRDLAQECRNVLGNCSGEQRKYELRSDTGEVINVWFMQ